MIEASTTTHVKPGTDPAEKGLRLTTDDVFEELKANHAAKEKTELLLSNLVKLKADIAAIEAKYVLNDDFSKICDDAIVKMTAVKTALEKAIESKVGDLDVFETRTSNIEARAKLGLTPPETYTRHKRPSNQKARPKAEKHPADDGSTDLIDSALDGIGDGIIWLGERIVKIFHVPPKPPHP